jgi:phage shock protein PspC (stress-responsive transcriptional regulator)
MNKVITINLNGVAYQLEEGGYDALRAYLENAARRLEGNPDKDEIIADIEQAIADKFRALLGAHKTVVNTKEVAAVIAEMGPVEDTTATEKPAAAAGGASGSGPAAADGPTAIRRLYRIYPEGAMLSGVCNGLSAYFNIDVTIFRIGFVFLSLLWGTGVLLYIFMVLLIPLAKTPAQKAAASGAAATAEEFIRRAKAGYYEGFRTFHDKQAHREWKRRFREEMRGWKYDLRREMHEHVSDWAARHPGHPAVPLVIGPIISLLLLVLTILWLYEVYTLVTAGCVFGLGLPFGMPVWLGVVLMIVAFQFVVWPLKALRHACYFPGLYGRPYYRHWHGPFGGLFGLGILILCVWLADRNVPEFHAWLMNLPPALHHVFDSLQAWWARK